MQRLPDHMRAMLSTRNPSDNWNRTMKAPSKKPVEIELIDTLKRAIELCQLSTLPGPGCEHLFKYTAAEIVMSLQTKLGKEIVKAMERGDKPNKN